MKLLIVKNIEKFRQLSNWGFSKIFKNLGIRGLKDKE